MDKINIAIVGGCAPEDILKSDRSHIDLYNITYYTGSLSRHHNPGKVAARLKEEMHDILNQVIGNPNYDFVLMQILYVIKEHHTPYTFIDNLPENTVVIVDPAYEIKSFYFDGDEMFDIHLGYNTKIRPYMPDWFNTLISKHRMVFDNGSKEIAMYQYKSVVNYLKYLEKKNLPVIMIGNLYTKKIFDETTNHVADALPLFNSKIPFAYKEDTLGNYTLINRFYEVWEDVGREGFKIFSPDINMIYADPNHRCGYHPTHLHYSCRKILNNELRALIVEAIGDHKKKIILPEIIKR